MIESNKITALISLLDDPDDFVFNEVKNKLLSYGDAVIPLLEDYWEDNPLDNFAQNRIENIIQQIQHDAVKLGLQAWKDKGAESLMEGILLINRFQYPDLDVKPIIDKIEQIKRDVWIELNNGLTSFEKVNIINQVIFDIYGFNGNKQNYHSPSNSYLSDVIETKKGNPLSLSIIYLLVTQELELPIYGVNLPSHFVLCYMDEHDLLPEIFKDIVPQEEDKVLMYINPFSRGTIFNRKEIERFLEQLKIPTNDKYFDPCSSLDIVKRLVNNLIFSYEKQGLQDKSNALKELKEVLYS